MAKNRSHVIQTLHPVARSQVALFMVPIVAIPLLGWAYVQVNDRLGASGADKLAWWWWLAIIGVPLLFPLWAKFKARFFHRYQVTLDAVLSQEGFLSRRSSEIRILDIRNIVVTQSFADRLLFLGDVSFSSAAGTHEEVRFKNVGRPNKIKALVKDVQSKLADGDLSAAELRELTDALGNHRASERPAKKASKSEPTNESAPATAVAASAPAPAAAPPAVAAPESADSSDDDLYRLLAQQEAEGKSEAGSD